MNLQFIWYLLAIIIIKMAFGTKAAYWFALLVLFGVLIANADKLKNLFTNPLKTEVK
jgi:hypothetical protein